MNNGEGDGDEQGLWEAVDCPVDWVTHMLHLGPSSWGIPGGEMAVDHLAASGGERHIRPRHGDAVAFQVDGLFETAVRWQRLKWAMAVATDSESDDRPLQPHPGCFIHYFAMAVCSTSPQDVMFSIHHADELHGWVDGHQAFQWDDWDAGAPRQLLVHMQPGWHQLLFKLCERPGGTWFAVRISGRNIQMALELPPTSSILSSSTGRRGGPSDGLQGDGKERRRPAASSQATPAVRLSGSAAHGDSQRHGVNAAELHPPPLPCTFEHQLEATPLSQGIQSINGASLAHCTAEVGLPPSNANGRNRPSHTTRCLDLLCLSCCLARHRPLR
eukprot:GGOE01040511.1.p1 GENE.GGOE01040511.1~~GGOE01040511.1.p1  ORF type:complete len:329 (-),score=34.37 GGOE01040511.1:236-1222(-)